MMSTSLCYITRYGVDTNGLTKYQFYYTDDTDGFWGEGFDVVPAGICNEMLPLKGTYCEIKEYSLNVKLELAQDNTVYSFQDVMDGILAIAYESLEGYDEYPENGRLVLHFGESKGEVEKKLGIGG